MARNDWERTGWDVPPRFHNVYGLKGSKKVIWIDNWAKRNWAVVLGVEHKSKGHSVTYEEKETLANFSSKNEANAEARKYMETN